MTVFINPGSGPVEGASVEYATTNMATFMGDLIAAGHTVEAKGVAGNEDDGRWPFVIKVDGVLHEIDMPGIPIANVRWMDEPEQNIWDFPRLYVDGSSWVWKYALGACERDED